MAWGSTTHANAPKSARPCSACARGLGTSQVATMPTAPPRTMTPAATTAHGEDHQKPHTLTPPVTSPSHTSVHAQRSPVKRSGIGVADGSTGTSLGLSAARGARRGRSWTVRLITRGEASATPQSAMDLLSHPRQAGARRAVRRGA